MKTLALIHLQLNYYGVCTSTSGFLLGLIGTLQIGFVFINVLLSSCISGKRQH